MFKRDFFICRSACFSYMYISNPGGTFIDLFSLFCYSWITGPLKWFNTLESKKIYKYYYHHCRRKKGEINQKKFCVHVPDLMLFYWSLFHSLCEITQKTKIKKKGWKLSGAITQLFHCNKRTKPDVYFINFLSKTLVV